MISYGGASRIVLPARGFASAGLIVCCLLFTAGAAEAGDWSLGERPTRSGLTGLLGQSVTTAAPASVADPVGDTFESGDEIDITSLSAEVVGSDLVVRVTFTGPVSTPDSDQSNALGGFIDIDADQNGATGDMPWTDFASGMDTTGMGNEFYVDLFSFDGGTVDVVDDPAEVVVGQATLTISGNTLTVTIPLGLLGGDGAVNVATILGTVDTPTDKAPNQGSVASTGDGGGPSILLNNDRFRVSVVWTDFQGNSGPGQIVPFRSDDSGLFWFFAPDNWEMLIKVLNGCGVNDHYWVFFAATTNVEFVVTVEDTQTGETETYTNPLGQPADAVTDTSAFATCP